MRISGSQQSVASIDKIAFSGIEPFLTGVRPRFPFVSGPFPFVSGPFPFVSGPITFVSGPIPFVSDPVPLGSFGRPPVHEIAVRLLHAQNHTTDGAGQP